MVIEPDNVLKSDQDGQEIKLPENGVQSGANLSIVALILTQKAQESLKSPFQKLITPALPTEIQEDSRYHELLLQSLDAELSKTESSQAIQEKFSLDLLNLLREWQENIHQESLENIQQLGQENPDFAPLNGQKIEEISAIRSPKILILTAIAEIKEDCPDYFQENLQQEISQGVSSFLEHYYSLEHSISPVEYYDNSEQESVIKLDINTLQNNFDWIPTAIISSEITAHNININVVFWTFLKKFTIEFSLSPWNWSDFYEELTTLNHPELQSLRNIQQIIVNAHQLLAGFIADWYYLHLNIFYQPQLHQFQFSFPPYWISPYLETLDNSYNLNQAEIYYQQGKRLLKSQEWIKAMENFDKALQRKPKNAKALKGRGVALLNLLRYEDALIDLEKALDFKPGDHEIWTFRGHVFYQLNRLEQAIESYESALQIQPNYQEAVKYHWSAVEKLMRRQKKILSQKNLPQSLNTNNLDSFQEWLTQGRIKFQEGQWEEALSYFNQSLKLNPNNYEALKWQGFTFFNLQEWKNAIASFDKALVLKERNYRLWYYRGRALYYLGNLLEAIASYDQAITLNPEDEKAIKYRRVALEDLKNIK